MRKLLTILSFILIISKITVSAQEKIKVISQGTFTSSSLSPNEIEQKAVKDAKVNALRQAGIYEKVGSVTVSFNSEIDENLLQIFEETTTIETKGEILVDTILKKDFLLDEFNNVSCDVEIESTIYKYNKESDATFNFDIKGINEFYNINERLKFSFTPSQDGYLKIFNITRNKVSIIYPYENKQYEYLNDKKDQSFIKDQEINFPIHPAFKKGYSFNLEENINSEVNHLLFVYTKESTPYYGKMNIKELYRWIFSISPDLRVIKHFSLLITTN